MSRVLYICNSIKFLDSHRSNLIQRWLEEGADVTIFTFDKDEDVAANYQSIGAKVIQSRTIMFLLRMIFFQAKSQFDIVHAITAKGIVLSAFMAKVSRRGERHFVSVAGLGQLLDLSGVTGQLYRGLYKWAIRTLERRKAIFIVQNSYDKKYLLEIGVFGDRISKVLGSGVNDSFFEGRKSRHAEERRVLFASRLLKSKGVGDFVVLSKRFARPGLRFQIAGDADFSNPDSISEAEFQELKHSKTVEYLGNIPNIRQILSVTDLVVYPSVYGEGIPKFICETMAMSVPVLAYDAPWVQEVITDDVSSFVVKAKDIESLCKRFVEVIYDHEKLTVTGLAAQRFARDNFRVAKVTDFHFKLYKQ